jgi:selenocysteine lyase/cysteine desulfurase
MGDVSRRRFLAGSGALAGGLAFTSVAACTADAPDAPAGSQAARSTAGGFDPRDWRSVRDQFSLTHDLSHFAAFVLAAHPAPVAHAIERHRAGLDQDPHGYLTDHEVDNEIAVRAAAAEYLDAAAGEVALTDSTTMGLGLLYGGLRLRADQEVLTTEHDFYSTHEALRLRSARTGSAVKRVRLYDSPADASVDEIVGRLLGAVTPSTRAVAVTWVHSGTGVKLPIAAIADGLRDLNADRDVGDRALLCVDGVHGLGVEDTTTAELGCDFLVAGTHKWLFGPRGTGIVWGRAEAWAAVDLAIAPFEPVSYVAWVQGTAPAGQEPGLAATPGGYHSFDHRWALAEAFRFHLAIGKAAIAARTHEQATLLKEGLTDERNVTVVTPMSPELSAGIVCVRVDSPQETLERLSHAGISAGMTPYAEPYVRFGPSIVTSPEEVDALIEAMSS